MPDGIWILLIVIALLVGVLVGGYFMFNRGKQVVETKFERLGKDAAKIIEDAVKEGI